MAHPALTYSHSLLIPLTRSCGAHCNYCTFKNNDDKLLSFDEIEQLLRTTIDTGICEVVLTSGQSLETLENVAAQWISRGYSSFIDYVRDICQLILENRLLPSVDIGPMSYTELESLAPYVAGVQLNLENINPEFSKSVQQNKSLDAKIETLSDAGLLRIPVTTGILIGAGESPDDLFQTIDAIAELHHKHGHIQSVIFQPLFLESAEPQTGVDELQRLIKYAKNTLPNVAISLPANAPVAWFDALAAGVDDIGRIFEGYDGLDWKKPFPKLTEVERGLGRKGFFLKPRFPIFAQRFEHRSQDEQIASVFKEWMNKKEFVYYWDHL